ncbi:cryptochrome/photolyase family protein [Yoonia sediminilitoris]|uniref:Deoxyribodipyrimidine photolyase-related protein n=1 Tax=Yoonia sediminilitoris TaxID=1286148 RepID=A0A2T6KKC3_9RHOB|nr:cryptochrome/photolyase family protein [Yoonia sediminilitoris]PUB16414.1 deoxyribodipyrimidine photolyase-related protein [Yoonia sediminilitoris]RCW96763.1 deoxyribodipyrimidine photolyase-related protein [Yoonia sediminilitoris]
MRLVLVLGDQLSSNLSALRKTDKANDVVVMAEVMEEATYVPHHPKKIAFTFAAMRKFARKLRDDGWKVAYTKWDEPDNSGSITGELIRRASEHEAAGVVYTEPGEWRLIEALGDLPIKAHQLPDDRFIASHDEFDAWAEGRKQLRMEYFYRDMRRKTGLLMDGDQPEGGKWNYDHDNRKPAPDQVDYSGPMQFTPDDTVQEVLELVADRFADNFGNVENFWFATDQTQARRHLTHWIKGGLPKFGDFQDAMLNDNRFLYHAIIGLYINAGLLDPLEVCQQVEQAYLDGDAPLNAVEGFIRQIIGWREYVRGIYFREGPDYNSRNALDHTRNLPAVYWGGETKMNCMAKSVAQTRDEAYAHHIQRLMVTGNFALLAGVDPVQVHEWYLAVYADAYEWVEAPNVIGMSQFADGGIIASKPYISSGNYIHKMSDYCGSCAYKVKDKTGPDACPFNLLYWHFLDRHRERFKGNPRMGNMYRVWDRMDEKRRDKVLKEAQDWLDRLDAGTAV